MVQLHSLLVFFICYLMIEVTAGDELPPPLVSRRCKNIGICESVANYPTLLARKLIQELKKNNTIFISDSQDDEISEEFEEPRLQLINSHHMRRTYKPRIYQSGVFKNAAPKLNARFSDIDDDYFLIDDNEIDEEIELCKSTVQSKSPQLAENGNNTWEYILNDYIDPIQTYRYVICSSSNSRCSQELIPAANYQATCIQKWTFKEMYYIDRRTGQLAKDYFKVPSCCSCKLFHIN